MGGAGTLLGIWLNPAGAVHISGSACRVYNNFRLLRLIMNEYIPPEFATIQCVCFRAFALNSAVMQHDGSHCQNI